MSVANQAFFLLSEAPGDEEEGDVSLPNNEEDTADDSTTDTAPAEEEPVPPAEPEPTEEPVDEEPVDGEEVPEPDTTEEEAEVDKVIDADSAENMKIHALYERFEENERVLISIRDVLQDLQARNLDNGLTRTILTIEKEVNDTIDKVKIVLEGEFTSENYAKLLTVFTYVQSSIILVDKIIKSFLEENDEKDKGKK
jgi:hypothetical protein